MARIISQINPDTGRRTKVAEVTGKTFGERVQNISDTLDVSAGKAKRLSGQEILKGLSKAPNITDTGAIKLSTLTGNVKPVDVNTPALAAPTQSNLSSVLQQKAATSATQEASSFEDYLRAELSRETPSEIRGRIEGEQGITELDKQNEALKSEITKIEEDLRKEVEGIETEAGTATKAERNLQVAEKTRVAYRKRADVAITQLAQQGQLDAAQRAADTAVLAETEYQQKRSDIIGMMYQRYKELFNKDEQRAFDQLKAESDREAEFNIFKMQSDYQQQIKQNDPLYKAQLAKTLAEFDSGNVTVTNPQAARFAGALNTILASGKFTKDQQAALIIGINQGEDPFTVIKNQAKNLMGSTQSGQVDNLETANAQLDRIQGLLSDFYANGGSTDIFQGNYETSLNKLGTVNDPNLVEIATELAVAMQAYRLAVTGTAASVKEDARIEVMFPGINSTQGLNQAKMNALTNSFQEQIDQKYKNYLGNAYEDLKRVDDLGAKGESNDSDFVSKSLEIIGASYDDALAKVPPGMIGVVNNKTGEIQAVYPQEFDAELYTRL